MAYLYLPVSSPIRPPCSQGTNCNDIAIRRTLLERNRRLGAARLRTDRASSLSLHLKRAPSEPPRSRTSDAARALATDADVVCAVAYTRCGQGGGWRRPRTRARFDDVSPTCVRAATLCPTETATLFFLRCQYCVTLSCAPTASDGCLRV